MVESIYRGLFRGAAWTVAMRWMLRVIGLVNIVILARLLTPFDFGIVGMAVLVSSFARNFTEMGAQQLLIRQQDITREDINAAWTIQVMQGLLVSVIIIVMAPIAAVYFDNSRIEPVLCVLALAPMIRCFRNIGLTLARRDLNFSIGFHAQMYSRLAEFVVTLILVLWLRSYWALVLGMVFGAAVAVFVSYRIHPYRPWISSRDLGRYFRFASSIIPLRIARYGNTKVANIVAGGMVASAQFGVFNLASDFTNLLSKELVAPLSQGLFPGFSRINNNRELLAKVFEEMLNIAASFLLPAGVGLALVAEDLVPVILGQQWQGSVIYVQWFALAGAVGGISHMMSMHILIASGNETRAAFIAWFRLCLFVPVIVVAGRSSGGLHAIVQANLYFEILFLPASIYFLTFSLPISARQILGTLVRPLLSTVVMAVLVGWLYSQESHAGVGRLLLGVGLGTVTYGITLFVVWKISNCPTGAEHLFYNYIQRKLKSRQDS